MKRILFRALSLMLLFLVGVVCAAAKTYIVAVGISDYPGKGHDLTKCVSDAKAFKALYEENAGAKVKLLTNSNATAENITDAIETTFAPAKEDDIVIFYFSGHGYEGGFVPYSGNLSYNVIRNAMAKSKAKNKMIFADACFSGKIRTAKKDDSSVEDAKKSNVMLFLSSRHNETSIEMGILKNGLFTHYLLMGLKGKADANKDNVVTARELFTYVHQKVINLSGDKQHPVMWGKFSDNMPIMR